MDARLRSAYLGLVPAAIVLAAAVGAAATLRPAATRRAAAPPEPLVESSPPEELPLPTTATATDAMVELGRRLFFDPCASSAKGFVACADCHRADAGFSDPRVLSLEDHGTTARHSQSLVDASMGSRAHWDGEFASTASLVAARLRGGKAYYQPEREPDVVTASDAVERRSGPLAAPPPFAGLDTLPAIAVEGDGFVERQGPVSDTYGTESDSPVEARVGTSGRYGAAVYAAARSHALSREVMEQALSAYCATIRSGESPYDRFAAGDEKALSDSARRGLDLFRGAAGCASCHLLTSPRAALTDDQFHDTGVSWRTAPDAKPLARPPSSSLGLYARTHVPTDMRRFKTPSLRDVARHPPYMHDGSLSTLEAVVEHYARLADDPNLDPALLNFDATPDRVADLVAFLNALTSDRRPGLAPVVWNARTAKTRLRFVDADGTPLTGWPVALIPAGDVLPGFSAADARAEVVRTDASGTIEFAPRLSTHTKFVLGDGLECQGGNLVPDTCTSAKVTVRSSGRMRVEVEFRGGTIAPDRVVARHVECDWYPDRHEPTTVLRRTSVAAGEAGTVRATYEAPCPTDVGDATHLSIAVGSEVVERDCRLDSRRSASVRVD